jgi:outer membrane receptor protein involved in Fe transport
MDRPIHEETPMPARRHAFRFQPLALAAALALVPGAAALAQTAPAAAPAGDGLNLDRVVVTGSTTSTTKMKSSVSLSTVEGESVVTATATSAAEVLRSVPGLRAEASGGESNANVGVRGIPISAGGARYIQFQEDGLPILQFGDIAFATPDTWLRADIGLDRLEVLRGGSASTLATGGPGGIINFITKTGRDEGGSIQFAKGLGYAHSRVDLDVGGKIGASTRFWAGGFYRVGDGGRPGADGTEGGGQVRANLTHEFKGGFVRVSFKHLDDRSPTLLPTPVRYVNGRIEEIPGIDPRTAAFYNAGFPLDRTLTASNGIATSNVRDGLSAKTDAVGAEFEVDAGGGLRLANNFRWSRNSGRFIGIFPGSDVKAAPAGTTRAGGGAYSGNWFEAVIFNTQVDDAGLVANDAKLARTFDVGGGKLTATGGLYSAVQNLNITWNFNQYALSASGDNAKLLTVPGFVNGSAAFGGCCMNTQDAKYRTTAPYIVLGYEGGPFTGDASVRQDRNSAIGTYYQTLNGGGTPGVAYNLAAPNLINYDFTRTSFSLGGNFQLNKDFAVFARLSDGAAYNADRITFFNAPGLVNGSSPKIPVNEVRQLEGGVKWRSGGVSLFATLFFAKTEEINVDLTTTPIRVNTNKYDSKGLELEGSLSLGAFRMLGGVTYTDAEVTQSTNAAIVGKTPKRQAKFVYQLTPTFAIGDAAVVGANIVGTTKSKDDGPGGPVTIELPGYTAVNAFVSYNLTERATVTLAANNLFDTLGYTESNDGRGAARAINGRTVKLTLKHTF